MNTNPAFDACEKDLAALQTEVKRLLETHDVRLVFAALISSAVTVGQVLAKNGKSSFVVDAFIDGAYTATNTPPEPTIILDEPARKQ